MEFDDIAQSRTGRRDGAAAFAALGILAGLRDAEVEAVEALILRALDPAVPVQVLFAALDRYALLTWGCEPTPARPDPCLAAPRIPVARRPDS